MTRIERMLAGILTFGLALMLTGCPNPAKDKAKATVTEAGGAGDDVDPAAKGTIALNPSNTELTFTGAKVTKSHTGTFQKFTGAVSVDDTPESAVVQLDIDLGTVKTDTERLDGHLKSGDFFDVANHPTAQFVTREIKPADEAYTVTGDLTLRGVTKSVSFPADIEVSDDRFTMQAEFSINRHEWNVSYKGQADDLIRDDVVIKLRLDAPRAT